MIQIQKAHSYPKRSKALHTPLSNRRFDRAFVLSKKKGEHFHAKKNLLFLPLVIYSLKNNNLFHSLGYSLSPLLRNPLPAVTPWVQLLRIQTKYTQRSNLLDGCTLRVMKNKEYNLVGVRNVTTQQNIDYKQKISLKKRKPIKRIYKSKRKIKGILGKLYISSTKNNTIYTLIDTNNNTKGWSCSGSLGFKNARKSTTYAAQGGAESMVKKAKLLGYTHLRLLVKGLGRGKQSCLRALSKSGLKIISLEDRTGIPYNGCRASKKRRV